MKNIVRKLVLATLLLTLFLSLAPGALAQEKNTPKQETVYVILDASGTTEKILVVNRFTLDEAGTVHDYGPYSDVSRLTGEAEISRDGEHIFADVEAGEWFYEGELAEAELPWLFELDFSLNGEELEPKDLSGAEGSVEFRLKVKANPDCPEHFRQSFFLQVMLELESARATDIRSNAVFQTVAGKNLMLNWMILPGQEQELYFKAQVKDFAMNAPQLAGLPLNFDSSALMIGDEEIRGLLERSGGLQQIEELEDAVVQFDEGAGELEKGSSQIKEAIEKIHSGVAQMKDEDSMQTFEAMAGAFPEIAAMLEGMEQLAGGLAALNEGYTEFHQGLSAYADGMSQFREGVDGMGEKLPARLKDALGHLFPPYEAESFVSDLNEEVLSVQFIFTWPAIPMAEQAE